MMEKVARAIAIVIAILAIVDPAITTARPSRPIISVVAATDADTVLAARTARVLGESFDVIPNVFSAAAATVVIGRRLPEHVDEMRAPVFVVERERSGPAITIEAVRAPRVTTLESRVPVVVSTHVSGARGQRVEVTLRAGALASERVSREMSSDDERMDFALSFVPVDTGIAALRVSAAITPTSTDEADVAIAIRPARFRVFFFDPRPSWMSTFVRRAIERDIRFDVASRTITSPGISTDIGRPPQLDDARAIRDFDVIVIGAPEALRERDVDVLDVFLRERGGSIVFLMDRPASGPHTRLAGVTAWRSASHDGGLTLTGAVADSGELRAADIAWPSRLPPNATSVASASTDPIVWETSIGAGRLIVSGALDAWRYRASSTGFDTFWRSMLARVAAAAPPAIDVRVERAVLAPGEKTSVGAMLRDIALAPLPDGASVEATVAAVLESGEIRDSMRIWPAGAAGSLSGEVRAPNEPGEYRVVVSNGEAIGSASFLVLPDAREARPEEPGLLRMWASAHGGTVVQETRLASLADLLDSALTPEPRRAPWHPMRSPWWIVPFALVLGAEWWWRRRRGLA